MMWGFGGLMFVVCIGFMIWMMMGHGGHGTMGHDMMGGHGDAENPRTDTPERILANRLASGEIDVDEYDLRLKALGRPDKSAKT
jgi:hypothetical protein